MGRLPNGGFGPSFLRKPSFAVTCEPKATSVAIRGRQSERPAHGLKRFGATPPCRSGTRFVSGNVGHRNRDAICLIPSTFILVQLSHEVTAAKLIGCLAKSIDRVDNSALYLAVGEPATGLSNRIGLGVGRVTRGMYGT